MEQYTLNRFYFEAKAIIEKYGIAGKPNYKFDVDFSLEEREEGKAPGLHCRISYSPQKYDSHEPSYYGFGPTPYIALGQFEETLKEKTNKSFKENLSVEIPETTS